MKFWCYLGRLSYYLLWPGIWVYLNGSRRTRVMLISGEHILVVKGWLSDGKWSLPGGGLHGGELPLSGALRELKEETNISINTGYLEELTKGNFKSQGTKKYIYYFIAELTRELPTVPQPKEIIEVRWLDIVSLNAKNANPDTLRGISIWKKKDDFVTM